MRLHPQPKSYLQLQTAYKEQICFSWIIVDHINYIPGEISCPGVVGQHKLHCFVCFVFVLFFILAYFLTSVFVLLYFVLFFVV